MVNYTILPQEISESPVNVLVDSWTIDMCRDLQYCGEIVNVKGLFRGRMV